MNKVQIIGAFSIYSYLYSNCILIEFDMEGRWNIKG